MKMKNTLTTILLMGTLSFSSILRADEVVLPVVSKPSILQEGTQRDLTPDQIAELLPWAKNSKVFLEDLRSSMQGLSSADKVDRLELGIKSVVSESAPKNTELLMRYVLNRALVVNDILKAQIASDVVGANDTKIRVFLASINMAIRYYNLDMDTLNKKSATPFARFGMDYFSFLTELNKSIFDASAGYNIQRTALEWLQWDLYRDLKNTSYAPQIVKINNSLKIFPVKEITDAQALTYVRQMKLVASQLNLVEARDFSPSNQDVQTKIVENERSGSNNPPNISECSSVMTSTSAKNSCINYSKASYVSPAVIQSCGKIMLSDSTRLACIDRFMGDEPSGNTLSNIRACGAGFVADSGRITCLGNMRPYSGDSNTNEVIKECSSILVSDATRAVCIKTSLENYVSTPYINACGHRFVSDSTRLSCINLVVKESYYSSADGLEVIKVCGTIMVSDSTRLSCINRAITRNTDVSVIRECGKMLSDSSRLSCMN